MRRMGLCSPVATTVEGDGDEKGFCEPEGVIAEVRGGPSAKNGSGKKTEGDKTEIASFGAAVFSGFARGVGKERVVDAFGYIAEVAGGEGGVEGEAIDTAETGDLDRSDIGDDRSKYHLRKGGGEPAEEEDRDDLDEQTEVEGANANLGAEVFGGGDAGEVGEDGGEVRNDFAPVLADDGYAEKDDVAGHGGSEDVSVEEVDDDVQEATGRG